MPTPVPLRNHLAIATVRLRHLAFVAAPWAVRAWRILRFIQRLDGRPDLGGPGID